MLVYLLMWTTQLVNAYVRKNVRMFSQDFMAIQVPRQPHFILQLCICDFPIVYMWIVVNDVLGDHRLLVDRKLCIHLQM